MSASDIFHHAHLGEGELLLEDDSALATLPKALQNRLEDWLALELTAERMAQDELMLVGNYVAGDFQDFMLDIKGGWRAWELTAFDFILRAADPTQVEWQQHAWWNPDKSGLE